MPLFVTHGYGLSGSIVRLEVPIDIEIDTDEAEVVIDVDDIEVVINVDDVEVVINVSDN